MTKTAVTARKDSEAEERIEPDLQFAVLCDNVAAGPGGKPVFVGVFDHFTKSGQTTQFFVVVRWISGCGEHTTELRVLDPDLGQIFATPEVRFRLRDRNDRATSQVGFQNFVFPSPGVYWFEILLNQNLALAIPVPVFGPE